MGNFPDGFGRTLGPSTLSTSSSSVNMTREGGVTGATVAVWVKGDAHRPGPGMKVLYATPRVTVWKTEGRTVTFAG